MNTLNFNHLFLYSKSLSISLTLVRLIWEELAVTDWSWW